jgi:hypothetical protein
MPRVGSEPHEKNVSAGEDISYLRPRGHSHRLKTIHRSTFLKPTRFGKWLYFCHQASNNVILLGAWVQLLSNHALNFCLDVLSGYIGLYAIYFQEDTPHLLHRWQRFVCVLKLI